MNGGDINYTISVNGAAAMDTFSGVARSLSSLQQAGYRLLQTGSVIAAAVTIPLAKAAQAGLDFNSTMEQSRVNFTTMIGDAKKAVALVGDLTQLALKTPLDVQSVMKGTQTLLAFGLASDKVIPSIQNIGDVSLGNKERFERLTLAYAQMTAAGKMMGQDLLQMVNAGFNPLLIISEKTGISLQSLRKTMETTGISSELIQEAFRVATAEGGRFFNGMANAMTTFAGQMALLGEAVSITFGSITKPIFDDLRLKIIPGVIEVVRKLREEFDKLTPGIQRLITYFLVFIAAIGPLFIVLGGAIFAFATLSIMMHYISIAAVLAGGAVIGLVGGFIYLIATSETLRTKLSDAWTAITTVVGNAFKAIQKFWMDHKAQVIDGLTQAWRTVVTMMTPILAMFAKLFNDLWTNVKGTFEYLRKAFEDMQPVFQDMWTTIEPVLKAIGMALWVVLGVAISVGAGLVAVVGPAIQVLVDAFVGLIFVVAAVLAALSGDFTGAFDYLKQAGVSLGKVWDDAGVMMNDAFAGMANGFQTYISATSTALADYSLAIRTEFANAWNTIATIFETAINYMGNLWNQYGAALIMTIINAWNALVAFMQPILANFVNVFVNMYNELVPLWEKIKALFVTLGELLIAFQEMLGPVGDVIGGILWYIFGAFVSVFSGIVNAIAPAAEFIIGTITSIGDAFTALFKFISGDAAGAQASLNKALMSGALSLGDFEKTIKAAASGASSGWASYAQGSSDALAVITGNATAATQAWDAAIAGNNVTPGAYTGNANFTFNPIALPRIDINAISAPIAQGRTAVVEGGKAIVAAVANTVGTTSSLFDKFGKDNASGLKDVKTAVDDFVKALKQQTDTFANFAGMFDIFERKYISPERLANRLKAHLKVIQEWKDALVTLERRGVDQSVINDIRSQGPGEVDSVMALARGSDAMLGQYSQNYSSIYGIAGGEAFKSVSADRAQSQVIEKQTNLYVNNAKIIADSDVVENLVKVLKQAGVLYD